MRKRISTNDIAQLTGVSRSTVSCILNGRSQVRISAETSKRVIDAAAQLGYRRNNLSLGLIQGRTDTIGVIVPWLDLSYYAMISQGILDAADNAGYRVMQTVSRRDPEREAILAGQLLEHWVDGMICVMGGMTPDQANRWLVEVVRDEVACVFVGDRNHTGYVDSVYSDDENGAKIATRHLIELGHRRIAHICGSFENSTASDRLQGYKSALEEAGIAFEPALTPEGWYEPKTVIQASEYLLGLRPRPTAVFASNDYDAAIFLERARMKGLRVPEDIALVGFSNVEMAPFLGLTTVDQQPVRMGWEAVHALRARMQDRDGQRMPVPVQTNLVIRRTCGANPQWAFSGNAS